MSEHYSHASVALGADYNCSACTVLLIKILGFLAVSRVYACVLH